MDTIDLSCDAPGSLKEAGEKLALAGWDGGFPAGRLLSHVYEVLRYNRVLGLTAHSKTEEIVAKHVWESALLAALLGAEFSGRIADLGGGNGYPGMVIAAMCPKAEVEIIEAGEKRCAFLNECLISLAIKNAKVRKLYIDFKNIPEIAKGKFEAVTHRAFMAPNDVLAITRRLGKPGHFVGGFIAADDFSRDFRNEMKDKSYILSKSISFINVHGRKSMVYLLADAD